MSTAPRSACIMVWPDGDPSESLLDHYYQVSNLIAPVHLILFSSDRTQNAVSTLISTRN